MNRDELITEIYDTINEIASNDYTNNATNCLMKKIDAYVETAVETAVIKARLEVMKNFGAI